MVLDSRNILVVTNLAINFPNLPNGHFLRWVHVPQTNEVMANLSKNHWFHLQLTWFAKPWRLICRKSNFIIVWEMVTSSDDFMFPKQPGWWPVSELCRINYDNSGVRTKWKKIYQVSGTCTPNVTWNIRKQN